MMISQKATCELNNFWALMDTESSAKIGASKMHLSP